MAALASKVGVALYFLKKYYIQTVYNKFLDRVSITSHSADTEAIFNPTRFMPSNQLNNKLP